MKLQKEYEEDIMGDYSEESNEEEIEDETDWSWYNPKDDDVYFIVSTISGYVFFLFNYFVFKFCEIKKLIFIFFIFLIPE